MATIRVFRARVIQWRCDKCLQALQSERKQYSLGSFDSEIVELPIHWFYDSCPHMAFGYELEPLEVLPAQNRHPGRTENEDLVDSGLSWLLDHSRNIGYPAREVGRYGSYPGHDSFDDESGPDGGSRWTPK